MKKIKLVCFDLDDTLIREIHSVMLPCILNGKEEEHSYIQREEEMGKVDYISADYRRVVLFKGLEENSISKSFLKIVKPLKNIESVIKKLHAKNIRCIVITVGPKQVAKVVSEIWNFDYYYGSDYEVENGIFTGKISTYITAEEKIDCLKEYCNQNNIENYECVAVGDGSTDIPLFDYCGKSIAINSSEEVAKKATHALKTDDLEDVLEYVIDKL